MLSSILLLQVLTVTVIGSHSTPLLFRRQTQGQCSDIGQKTCGDFCIDLTDTCCPDQSGGCPLATYCTLGDNGEYGCCDVGKTCVGDGGVDTSTIFTDLPGTQSTITDDLIPSETSRPADDTSIATPISTPTSRSTPTSDDASVSSSLVSLSSRASTSASTTRTPTSSTAQAQSTGAASGQSRGISGLWFAVALPIFAL